MPDSWLGLPILFSARSLPTPEPPRPSGLPDFTHSQCPQQPLVLCRNKVLPGAFLCGRHLRVPSGQEPVFHLFPTASCPEPRTHTHDTLKLTVAEMGSQRVAFQPLETLQWSPDFQPYSGVALSAESRDLSGVTTSLTQLAMLPRAKEH